MRRLVVMTAVALLAACGGDSTGPKLSAAGSWLGSSSNGINATMVLNESGTAITGSGQMNGPSGSVATSITGNRSDASVSLTISATGFQPINFSGTLTSATQMQGSMNGSGFTNAAITFMKQ